MSELSEPFHPEDQSVVDKPEKPKRGKIAKYIVRGLGAAAVVAAVAFAAPHADEAKGVVIDEVHWAGPALIGTEIAWGAGAALMLGAAGVRVGNPLKLRKKMEDSMKKLGESTQTPLFKAGMVTNIVGEIVSAAIITGGSIVFLPPQVWPLTIGTNIAMAIPSVAGWSAYAHVRRGMNQEPPPIDPEHPIVSVQDGTKPL